MLGPPVSQCYDSDHNLVAYHMCAVKYYTCRGAALVDKVTLRHNNCDLFYTYTIFRNKERLGFCHYPWEREAVEALDCVYFECSLLELQCSLV